MNTDDVGIPILRSSPFLALVIPCYNEEQILPHTMERLSGLLDDLKSRGMISRDSFACYVDDGSGDSTWNLLLGRHQRDPFCKAIKLAANSGQQSALWAGLHEVREMGVDCAISLDVDLQDDIGVIPEMLSQWSQGSDIVYGVRNSRSADSVFKRNTARFFYFLLSKLNLAVIPDHADFRLMGKPALQALRLYGERNLFIRGLVPTLGFKSSKVYYQRLARQAGDSKYSLRKMISFAWTGITASSAAPLRFAGIMGFLCMLLAIFLGFVFIWKWAGGDTIPGWTSLGVIILFLGSIQLFCLALIGEYIAKIYTEVRRRPLYIIEKKL